MAGLAGKRGCLEGESRVCAGKMLHRSEGRGPRSSTPWGPAPPPAGLEVLLRLLWEGPGLGGSVLALGCCFQLELLLPASGALCRVPTSPPSPDTNAAKHTVSPAPPHCASRLSGRDSLKVFLQKMLSHQVQEVQAWG